MRAYLTSMTATLLLGCGLQFHGAAMAAPCDGSSDPCSIDLGRASANFTTGAASYWAEAVLVNGSDASFNANPQLMSVFQVTHAAGSDSFLVQPQVYAYVGGSGVQGLHEVAANLQFIGLSFTANAGYQITGVQAVVKGSYAPVGNAYGGVGVPGVPQWNGESFTSTFALDPAAADVWVGFSLAASYLEGEDGTADSYGAGSASIDSLEFVVSVTAVPEPASFALLGAGLAFLAWRRQLTKPR